MTAVTLAEVLLAVLALRDDVRQIEAKLESRNAPPISSADVDLWTALLPVHAAQVGGAR